MEVLPSIIQYGALGLLALVLYAVYHYIKLQVQEQSRMNTFVIGLVERTIEDESKQLTEWKEMVRESINAQNSAAAEIFKNGDSIRQLTEQVAKSREESRESMQKLIKLAQTPGEKSD